jgi:hypothetical protein
VIRESLKMAICRAKNPPRNEKSRQANPHSLPIHTIHPVDFSFLTGFYAFCMRILRLLRPWVLWRASESLCGGMGLPKRKAVMP